MYNKEVELKLIEKVNSMDIEELKKLALRTLITREKTRLRNQKYVDRKKKGQENNEVQ